MDRRNFLIGGTLTASGLVLANYLPSHAQDFLLKEREFKENALYEIFKSPGVQYRPFFRWWWNGDKIEKKEIVRELRLLKAAGIGGVEIYPIGFPFPNMTDDLGIPSLKWLSDDWLNMLQFAFEEAASLNMDCSLIADTGFPFGGEFLEEEDRTQVVVIGVKKMKGPLNTEFSLFDLYKEADPEIYYPYSGRTMEMLSVKLIPDPLDDMRSVVDLSEQIKTGFINVSIPEGQFALYALVKVEGFEEVLFGAPGGAGPVLNHFSKNAVQKYLDRLSGKIEKKINQLPSNFKSFFVDSLELQGANWTSDMRDEFQKRRGYDIFPYLPFILFKIGRMGNLIDPDYTVQTGDELTKTLTRMRYDWALTNAEVFRERFVDAFVQWCRDNKIKSRVQAYGRGYFLLEGSFPVDIPECETWVKYGIGKDIPEDEFTRWPWQLGQGNTMINKYVSSAAHLKDKRMISSEELTNIGMVFNESFEIFKIAGDQSTISGVTRPVFHGFNYSPPEAPFPGWIVWGGYFNDKNTVWPYFNLYVEYRARITALLQQGTMYADIALLAPIPDMWGLFGAQNEPFPTVVWPNYQMLIWESIHQNGNGCDYVSEQVIKDAVMQHGLMHYGSRRYKTIFLIEVRGIHPDTMKKLYDFVSRGGRIFCIEDYPDHYPGWYKHTEKDEEVKSWVEKMKRFTGRFILINKPDHDFCTWIGSVQEKYKLPSYVKIDEPCRYITQVRYQMPGATEVFFFINSSDSHDYTLKAAFNSAIVRGKQAWLWDAVTGERFKLQMNDNRLSLPLGPATSAIIVFNKDQEGNYFEPIPLGGDTNATTIDNTWHVQFQHYDGHTEDIKMEVLSDLKDIPQYSHFAGTVKYKNTFPMDERRKIEFLNLGKVYGISIVRINGKDAGIKWSGNRIYPIKDFVQQGNNTIEIWVVTVMLNYMKALTDNKIAQYWTNEGAKNQPLQSLGLEGPVSIY